MEEDVRDEGMVKGVDTVAYDTFTKERQPQAVSGLSYHQPNQPPQQELAPSYPQPTQGQGWGTADRRTSRPGRSTVEQIFGSQVIREKHLQHQHNHFHNFIDFKKVFDRVWKEGLVLAIQALYEISSSGVLLSSQLGEFFKTTAGSVTDACSHPSC